MSLSVKFNGHELNKYIEVTKLTRSIGPDRTNSLQKLGMAHGEQYLGYTKGAAIHEMKFAIISDLPEKKRELAGILDVSEPSELIFGDEPDKYMLAVPDGDIDFDDEKRYGIGTIKWIVPAGYSEAVQEKTYLAAPNPDGILQIELNNTGTETTELSFDATMTSDNGFLGAVGPLGAFEVGNAAEVDGHTYQRTDVVAKNTLTPDDKSNWLENSPNAQTVYPIVPAGIPNKIGQGSFSWTGEAPTPSYPNNSDECWIGPTLSRDIPKNSNEDNTGNFDAIWRGTFSTKTVKEVGREEFNLVNGNQIVCAFVIRDSSYSKQALTCDYYIYLNGERDILYTFDVDLKKAQSSWFEIRISRIGAAITFKFSTLKSIKNDEANLTYFTNTKTFTKDEYANVPITGTHFWPHAKWANRPVARLGMSNFVFRWINVDKWADDPNRYSADDVLHYDGTTGKFYVNQLLAMNDIIQGSVDLRIPPGNWAVEFYYSDFAEPPIVTGTLRERWL